MKRLLPIALLLLAAASLFAQPADSEKPRVFRSELELQLYRFGNFFQAREGQPEESINGYGAEYRAAYRAHPDSPDLYVHLNVLNYAGDNNQVGYGGRVGIAHYGSVHSYNVYLDRQENGFAFDVGDRTSAANVTSAGASYANRFTHDWQAGVDGYYEQQRFDVETGSENDYHSVGAQIRYRGLGQILTPRVGYVVGTRDVPHDRDESYDESYWYVQLNSVPTPRVQLALRYRSRGRDYDTNNRKDDRTQWVLRGTVRQNARLSWTGSYTQEHVDSNQPGRDFSTNSLFVGAIVGF